MSVKAHYACSACGASYKKWIGKCEDCGEWNTIVQEMIQMSPAIPRSKQQSNSNSQSMEVLSLDAPCDQDNARFHTQISELDRVFGGGIVKGSATLLGGDPGIGKSTILLQAAAKLAANGLNCLYISAEESTEQVRMRAQRLNIAHRGVKVASVINVEDIISSINRSNESHILIIDSIQTVYHGAIPSAPGTVNQVRTCAFELIRLAKNLDIALILVGHVTKDGQIAGPKVLEHMVDTVLYFEGDRGHDYRIIRAVKNRYGAANEIGVFEMSQQGLHEVLNPSALFLPKTKARNSGSCVFAGIEGSRPLLLEIQALVAPSYLATPRRATIGWDSNRLAMMIAVLNARYGLNLLDKEVYLNITGGIKVTEPAADLAVMAALIAASKNIQIDENTVLLGEVGLSGEVRPVSQLDARLQEALKLGFTRAIIPYTTNTRSTIIKTDMVQHISQLQEII
ncbi:MAG: DNA repair protein RadA [Proteobacteria bacterium]|nr:DNA repair protein RadA [Pseudomonadota bacterium]